MMLSGLSSDALDKVAQHLSPKDVGKLMQTCQALAIEATPRHPSWALLRADLKDQLLRKKHEPVKTRWFSACVSAAERGDVQSVRWVGAQGHAHNAAGHVHHLEWLNPFEYYRRRPYLAWLKTFSAAAKCGHLEVLRWLRPQTPPCTLDGSECDGAARNGQLEIVQWLRALIPPCPWGKNMCSGFASNGHLEGLQWLRAQTPPCPWNECVCSAAAEKGHLDVLRWARVHGCPWDSYVCYWSAQNGHTHVMRWARAQNPPCPWCEYAAYFVASNGNLDQLQWMRASTPPCPWEYDDICCSAVRIGHLEMLQWLCTQAPPGPWGMTFYPNQFGGPARTFCTIAANGGHLEVLRWLRLQSSVWDAQTCLEAAQEGQFEVLEWLRRQTPPCPWDPHTILSMLRFNDRLSDQKIMAWVSEEITAAPMANLVL